MDDLQALAHIQGGYLHREQILAHGYSDVTIRAARNDGFLTRIRVGTFAFDATWRHLDQQQRAAVLAYATYDTFPVGTVVLSHHSACAIHGIATFGGSAAVHLTRLDRGAGRSESDVIHHAAPRGGIEPIDIDGRLVTSPIRAAWETACISERHGILVVFDSAMHLGRLSADEMDEWSERTRYWRGSRRARFFATAADAGAETPGETLMRIGYMDAGLPQPRTQYVITDEDGRFVARSDLAIELYRHVGEFDGLRKYLRDLKPGDNPSDVVVREKVREDAIRRLDYAVTRSIWSEVQPVNNATYLRRLARDVDQARKIATRRRVYVS